ncbi:hypothetical protein LOD99_13995 [Oopsacas minuta]|uniref:Uncharacterized protein n=1 Tax=Oopsacas minuta TaxID=111878 RepID=A0AAV7KJP3_9METZ|nr:hypothetical protein LOD99_13995 [Oopsacas minuta]
MDEKIYFSLNSPDKLLPKQTGNDGNAFHALNGSCTSDTIQPVILETVQNDSFGHSYVWRMCNRGNKHDGLFQPKGLAIDNGTEIIYVADCMNHRIQSFNKHGAHLNALKSSLLTYPWGIIVHGEFLYITCCTFDKNYLLKLCKRTGDEVKMVASESWLAGLDIDSLGNIYACEVNNFLQVFDDSLNLTKKIKLQSDYIKEDTDVWDVKIISDEFVYILCEGSQYPVQLFNMKGKLLKCVIHQSETSRGYFFHIDSDQNILISDNHESVIRMFNKKGDLILVLGAKEKINGEDILKTPTGISLNYDGNIVVCDDKLTHALQTLLT